MPGLLILQVKSLYLWQTSTHTLLCSWTTLKAVEHRKEIFLFFKDNPIFVLTSHLHQLVLLLQLGNEEGGLHLLLLVLFELKSFKVKGFEEIFVGNLTPVFDGMNFLYISQLINLNLNPFLEDLASLYISCFKKPLKLFLLISMAVLIDHLKRPQTYNLCYYFFPLLLVFFIFLVSYLLQQTACLHQSSHIKVKFISLVLGL